MELRLLELSLHYVVLVYLFVLKYQGALTMHVSMLKGSFVENILELCEVLAILRLELFVVIDTWLEDQSTLKMRKATLKSTEVPTIINFKHLCQLEKI